MKAERPDIIHFHEIAGSNGITFSHVKAAKDLNFKVIMTLHVSLYTAAVDNYKVTDDIFNITEGSKNFYRSKGREKSMNLFLPLAKLIKIFKLNLSPFGTLGTALSVPQLLETKRNNFLGLIANSDRIVTVAKWYFEVLVQNGINKDKLVYIEQGVNDAIDIRTQKSETNQKIRMIFVGRISKIKGVEALILAVNRLDNAKIELDIYGDSGENEEYIRSCKVLIEATKNIFYKGRVEPVEVLKVISGYDLLVLPSIVHEMSPLVIREAFAAGIPVLASDSMGAKEQIEDGKNGWLFKMNDVDDLTEKLKRLIEHPEKIREASQHIPASRSFSMVAREYLKLYRTILEAQSTALNLQR